MFPPCKLPQPVQQLGMPDPTKIYLSPECPGHLVPVAVKPEYSGISGNPQWFIVWRCTSCGRGA